MKRMLKNLIAALALFWLGVLNAAVIVGNPNGDITMIFIYDYQCPYCHIMYPIVQQLEQQFHNLKVRMMPVATLNMTSLYEAAAAIAATNTNQFLNFTNQVMAQGPMTNDQVTLLLHQMGLNSQQFQDTMHSEMVKQQLLQGQLLIDNIKAPNTLVSIWPMSQPSPTDNISSIKGVPLFIIYPSALDPSHSIVVGGEQSSQAMISAIQYVQQKIQQASQQSMTSTLIN